MFFLLIVASIPLCALAWWWWADRRLRGLKHAWAWRLGLAGFVLAHAAGFGWLLVSRWARTDGPPEALLASTYIWSLVLLPCTVLATLGLVVVLAGVKAVRGLRATEPSVPAAGGADTPAKRGPVLTRRQAIANLGLVGVPMLAQGASVARGISQLDEFRVREIEVPCPGLPAGLNGLTIAHVSDTHVGRFTRGAILDTIARRVHELDADLVCFTGDLIDYTTADLPNALAMARQFRGRYGAFMCEGNHDLFENRQKFRRDVRQAEVGMLVNETATIDIRGHRVQILGARWGGDGSTAERGAQFESNVARLAEESDPRAFRILLAHPPHAFDDAARAGIPLTLSGHTHGGQLNFAEGRGLVQAWFKYMSGLYTQRLAAGTASCVVSNGVGNWFPLRINAPAEVVRVTLKRAVGSTAAT